LKQKTQEFNLLHVYKILKCFESKSLIKSQVQNHLQDSVNRQLTFTIINSLAKSGFIFDEGYFKDNHSKKFWRDHEGIVVLNLPFYFGPITEKGNEYIQAFEKLSKFNSELTEPITTHIISQNET
jgi:hypothetical protein